MHLDAAERVSRTSAQADSRNLRDVPGVTPCTQKASRRCRERLSSLDRCRSAPRPSLYLLDRKTGWRLAPDERQVRDVEQRAGCEVLAVTTHGRADARARDRVERIRLGRGRRKTASRRRRCTLSP